MNHNNQMIDVDWIIELDKQDLEDRFTIWEDEYNHENTYGERIFRQWQNNGYHFSLEGIDGKELEGRCDYE